MDPVAVVVTFGTIFLVELPDKTFLATLVLATRYRPLLVWIGVSLAFAVQTVVAVLLGHAASFLPADLVQGVAAAMFLVGAVLLFREGRAHHQSSGEEYVANARDVHGVRQVLACFLILFAAEWGDLSQLFTITLVAKYEDPIGVFIGALGALMTVSALAVVAGKQLLRWIPLHVLHYLGAGVCLVLALVTGYESLGTNSSPDGAGF